MTTPYISWLGHGASNYAPPGFITDATMTMFAVDADGAALQALVDKLLNPAGGGVVRYEVAVPMVSFSFLDAAKTGAEGVGWAPGREAAIWLFLVEMHPGHPLRTRLVMWAPYIFINYCVGLVTGREVWGWPKAMADIAVAADAPDDPRYACSTSYFPVLATDSRAVTGTLYQVVRDAPATRPAPIWTTALEALEGLIGGFLSGAAEIVVNALRLEPNIACVALKQFRAAGLVETACYQGIANSPIGLTHFAGGGPLFDAFSVEITTCESHRIVQDILGVAPGAATTRLPVRFAGQIAMNCEILPGNDIVVVQPAA